MASLGKTSELQIIKVVDFGLYLDAGELGEILLPARYVPAGCKPGDWLTVFIYLDSEDKLIATTEQPRAEIGECALLTVVDTNSLGAFMDWGLSKDLFVPFKEQRVPMQTGRSYVVAVFEDNTGRICGSSKLDNFLNERSEGRFRKGQPVELLIASRSDLGYKAVIDGTHLGLIHNADALVALSPGQRMTGYIKLVRTDDAIDLVLQERGEKLRYSLTKHILDDLAANGDTSPLTDKSAADDIFARFQVSKGNYKKAIGQLYKEKKIVIEPDRITLVPPDKD
jgi:hypothetical protein